MVSRTPQQKTARNARHRIEEVSRRAKRFGIARRVRGEEVPRTSFRLFSIWIDKPAACQLKRKVPHDRRTASQTRIARPPRRMPPSTARPAGPPSRTARTPDIQSAAQPPDSRAPMRFCDGAADRGRGIVFPADLFARSRRRPLRRAGRAGRGRLASRPLPDAEGRIVRRARAPAEPRASHRLRVGCTDERAAVAWVRTRQNRDRRCMAAP